MVSPLLTTLPIGTRFHVGPYTPTTETMPPFFTELIAHIKAVAEPACNNVFLPVIVCSALPAASHPTASIHTSAPKLSVAFFRNTTGSFIDLKLYASHFE